jgi:hypothetical protein
VELEMQVRVCQALVVVAQVPLVKMHNPLVVDQAVLG